MASESVRVMVRVRPSQVPRGEQASSLTIADDGRGINAAGGKFSYTFDRVFGPDVETQAVYDGGIYEIVAGCLQVQRSACALGSRLV